VNDCCKDAVSERMKLSSGVGLEKLSRMVRVDFWISSRMQQLAVRQVTQTTCPICKIALKRLMLLGRLGSTSYARGDQRFAHSGSH
jgi:hypothetical protein